MPDCTTCREGHTTVPYIVHESSEARHERREKRLLYAIMLALALLFLSNAVWLWAWLQFDYGIETEESVVDIDAGGIATYVGEDGEINYGTYPSYQEEDYPDEKAP